MSVRPERLLPIACIAAAVLLFASQLMTMFEFTPPGGEPLDDRSVIEDHGHALFIVATFAAAATLAAVWAASKPAAMAVGAMGVFALLFFLLTDLPDAGQVGTLDDPRQSFFDAEAIPQAGFWLEMIGALALAVSGVALATLTPEQLAALRPGRLAARMRPPEGPAEPEVPAATFGAEAAPSGNARPAAPLATAPAAKLADELGVDLAAVRGSGKDGRITEADVEAASNSGSPARAREGER